MYNQKTIDHFSHPRNMGELKDFNATAEGGNPTCGDFVKLWVKLDKTRSRIADVKFKAFGCGACLASSSALTEIVKGKTVEYAKKIKNQDIVDYLGGLPAQKMICSNFSAEVLQKALKNVA